MDVVVLTGCSSGIGRATAMAFLDDGWTVYATARDTDDLVDLEAAGCAIASLDVTDDEQVAAVVDRIVAEEGRIDCLVNNAGYGQLGPLEDVPVDELNRQFDVNVYGPHRLTRAVLPHMRSREDGTIINLSSIMGRVSVPGTGSYAGSKFALEAMSDALRGEVAPFGIDVVLIEPGPVNTSFDERVLAELDRGLDRSSHYDTLYRLLEDTRTIGRGGLLANEPGEVAAVILNAASCTDPAARYRVGPVAKAAGLVRFLPDGVVDRLYGVATSFVR